MKNPDCDDLAKMYVQIAQGTPFEETDWPADYLVHYAEAANDLEEIIAQGGIPYVPGDLPALDA